MKCFNCGAEDQHYSRHCKEPQRYTRCPGCRRVCHNFESHCVYCHYKNFRSAEVSPIQIVESPTLVEIGFMYTKDLKVRSTCFEQKSITDLVEFVPKKVVIQKCKDGWYRFSSFPISGGVGDSLCYHRNIHILVFDQNNVKRLHIFITPDDAIINGQVRICADHVAKGVFNLPPAHHQIELVITTLSPTARKFGMSIKVFGKAVSVFDVKEEPALWLFGEGWWLRTLVYVRFDSLKIELSTRIDLVSIIFPVLIFSKPFGTIYSMKITWMMTYVRMISMKVL